CFGNRNDEFAAPLADMSHLLHDLILQVPGQDEQVVRSSLAHLIGGIDRNVSPRSKLPMLVGIPIDRIVKKICSPSTIVQQRIALAGGSVADDRLPFLFDLDQAFQKLALGILYLLGK